MLHSYDGLCERLDIAHTLCRRHGEHLLYLGQIGPIFSEHGRVGVNSYRELGLVLEDCIRFFHALPDTDDLNLSNAYLAYCLQHTKSLLGFV